MNKEALNKKFDRIKEKYLGEKGYLEDKFLKIYGGGDYESKIDAIRKKNKNKYLICIILLFVLLVWMIYSQVNASRIIEEDEKGFVTAIERSDDISGSVTLKAYVAKNGKLIEKNVNLITTKQDETKESGAINFEDENVELAVNYKIDEAVKTVAKKDGKKVVLPTKLSDGTPVYWQKQRSSLKNIAIIPLIAIILYAIYRKRFAEAEKAESIARKSVLDELPSFINRLTLLLGAGLVFNAAFEKAVSDSNQRRWKNNSYFYNQMTKIKNDSEASKSSIYKGLEDFAKRTQIREFIRMTNIITDGISKGTGLAEKLELESNAMWFAKKKDAEEKGRLAETKIIAPLMIMLVILIIITIAPAMMEM